MSRADPISLVVQVHCVEATKEAADKNDLHSLFSTSLLLPFRLAERLTASPFLNQPSILPLLIVAPEMGPFFGSFLKRRFGSASLIPLPASYPERRSCFVKRSS
jgi:hypothetical protein